MEVERGAWFSLNYCNESREKDRMASSPIAFISTPVTLLGLSFLCSRSNRTPKRLSGLPEVRSQSQQMDRRLITPLLALCSSNMHSQPESGIYYSLGMIYFILLFSNFTSQFLHLFCVEIYFLLSGPRDLD